MSTLPARLQGRTQALGTRSTGICVGARKRTVSNFTNIIGELKDRLQRWTPRRSTDSCSTTPKTLCHSAASRHSTLAGGATRPDVLEPLLFYVLHRPQTRSPIQASPTFKMFSARRGMALHQKNEDHSQLCRSGAENLGANINRRHDPATQSIKELEDRHVQIVSESCRRNLPCNPEMNRDVYRKRSPERTRNSSDAGLVPPARC